MNTIQNSTVHVAMDGQTLYNNTIRSTTQVSAKKQEPVVQQSITPTGAQVAQNLEKSLADFKQDVQELQKMTEMVAGNKLQFNVNKELDTVVVSIVDSSTNQVVKQIPSEDMLNLKLRIRKAIGSVFDEVI